MPPRPCSLFIFCFILSASICNLCTGYGAQGSETGYAGSFAELASQLQDDSIGYIYLLADINIETSASATEGLRVFDKTVYLNTYYKEGMTFRSDSCKRAFYLGSGALVAFYDGVTVTGAGRCGSDDCNGGAFYLEEGALLGAYGLTIQNSTACGHGGGVYGEGGTGVDIREGSSFKNNQAAGSGGAIYLESATGSQYDPTCRCTDVRFSNNSAGVGYQAVHSDIYYTMIKCVTRKSVAFGTGDVTMPSSTNCGACAAGYVADSHWGRYCVEGTSTTQTTTIVTTTSVTMTSSTITTNTTTSTTATLSTTTTSSSTSRTTSSSTTSATSTSTSTSLTFTTSTSSSTSTSTSTTSTSSTTLTAASFSPTSTSVTQTTDSHVGTTSSVGPHSTFHLADLPFSTTEDLLTTSTRASMTQSAQGRAESTSISAALEPGTGDQASSIIEGAFKLTVNDAEAFVNDAEANICVQKAIAERAGVGQEQVNVTFATETRRMRRLAVASSVRVEFSISLSSTDDSSVDSTDAVLNSLNSATPNELSAEISTALSEVGLEYEMDVTDITEAAAMVVRESRATTTLAITTSMGSIAGVVAAGTSDSDSDAALAGVAFGAGFGVGAVCCVVAGFSYTVHRARGAYRLKKVGESVPSFFMQALQEPSQESLPEDAMFAGHSLGSRTNTNEAFPRPPGEPEAAKPVPMETCEEEPARRPSRGFLPVLQSLTFWSGFSGSGTRAFVDVRARWYFPTRTRVEESSPPNRTASPPVPSATLEPTGRNTANDANNARAGVLHLDGALSSTESKYSPFSPLPSVPSLTLAPPGNARSSVAPARAAATPSTSMEEDGCSSCLTSPPSVPSETLALRGNQEKTPKRRVIESL